jgi:phenylpyruvate tautomerase
VSARDRAIQAQKSNRPQAHTAMPYLSIQTNVSVSAERQSELLAAASVLISKQLGKPESYVMVAVEPVARMTFAGSENPAAFLRLESIGLPDAKLKPLSAALCELIETHCGVPPNRVFIRLIDVAAKFWGHAGDTFG